MKNLFSMGPFLYCRVKILVKKTTTCRGDRTSCYSILLRTKVEEKVKKSGREGEEKWKRRRRKVEEKAKKSGREGEEKLKRRQRKLVEKLVEKAKKS